MKAAYKFIDARATFDYERDLVIAKPDPALVAPPLTVRLRRVAEYCRATWAADVIGAGPKVTIPGNLRLPDLMAVVKQRLPSGSPIGIDIRASIDLALLEPVLLELSTLGPLQLAIGVEGMPFPIASPEAPAWAQERIRAARAAAPSLPKHPLLNDLLRAADLGCAALQPVIETMNSNVNLHVERLEGQVTAAVTTCACRGVDADALEVAVALYLAGGARALTEGWLEFRIDRTSNTVVRVSSASRLQLVDALIAIPQAQRAAGVKLELRLREAQTPIDPRCP